MLELKKVLLSWSGGKDSAMALYQLQKDPDIQVTALLTTITRDYDRISMHGVTTELLEMQARSIGVGLEKVYIPAGCSNQQYEQTMEQTLNRCKAQGIAAVAFGDLFLEDIRRYREQKLALAGMQSLFPLWNRNSRDLAREFISLGFKAIVCCADSQTDTGELAGKEYDQHLLTQLPAGCDPCFENGECHTFVYDGPIFREPLTVKTGQVLLRDNRFYFCDIVPI